MCPSWSTISAGKCQVCLQCSCCRQDASLSKISIITMHGYWFGLCGKHYSEMATLIMVISLGRKLVSYHVKWTTLYLIALEISGFIKKLRLLYHHNTLRGLLSKFTNILSLGIHSYRSTLFAKEHQIVCWKHSMYSH